MKLGNRMVSNKIVTLIWRDAASTDAWHEAKDGDNPTGAMCCTTGYLIAETAHDLVITHTLAPDNEGKWDTCCSLAIPKCCVYEVYECKNYAKKIQRIKKTPV